MCDAVKGSKPSMEIGAAACNKVIDLGPKFSLFHNFIYRSNFAKGHNMISLL